MALAAVCATGSGITAATPNRRNENTRANTKAGRPAVETKGPAIRQLPDPRPRRPAGRRDGRSETPAFLGGVYEPPRAARRIAGPAFARREVSWPRSAETRVSPDPRIPCLLAGSALLLTVSVGPRVAEHGDPAAAAAGVSPSRCSRSRGLALVAGSGRAPQRLAVYRLRLEWRQTTTRIWRPSGSGGTAPRTRAGAASAGARGGPGRADDREVGGGC